MRKLEDEMRKLNSDGYEQAYISIGNTNSVNTSDSIMKKIGTNVPTQPSIPPIPKLRTYNPPKERIKRIYEDDDFIIDLFTEEQMIRVSIFEDNHYKDEVFVRKEEYV